MGRIASLFLVVFVISLFACGTENTSEGFDGAYNQPLDYSNGTYCVIGEDRSYHESVTVLSGSRSEGGYWAEGGGCILRPLKEVWAVGHNQPHLVWDRVDDYSVTVKEPPQNVTHFYEVLYKVKEFFITVDWTMYWFHSIQRGTFEDPKEVLINFQKVAGTSYIPYWKGSILLKEIAPGVTQFSIRWLIDASEQTEAKAAESVRTMYEKFRTGGPNWEPLRPAVSVRKASQGGEDERL
ncbi:MAG: hypothetical protein HY391_04460 [Deltaproteobacteria bacterium]|nr:hypothetical protein [Deltaproteobacteria bacterium]